MNDKTIYWFKRKKYGFGWTPVTWQGWLLIAAYVALIVAGALTLSSTPDNTFTKEVGIYILVIILATAALIRITLKKGPAPKWQWGDNNNE